MFLFVSTQDSKLLADIGDKRSRFARELLKSERQYVQVLEIIRDVYAVPLKSALASNRAILSISNVQIIFSDILNILQINKYVHVLTVCYLFMRNLQYGSQYESRMLLAW